MSLSFTYLEYWRRRTLLLFEAQKTEDKSKSMRQITKDWSLLCYIRKQGARYVLSFFQNSTGRQSFSNGERLFPIKCWNVATKRAILTRLGPSHTIREVYSLLNNLIANSLIGRYGPREWPSRSLHLTSPDFFLWGFIKHKYFKSPVSNATQGKKKITTESRETTEEMLNIWRNLQNWFPCYYMTIWQSYITSLVLYLKFLSSKMLCEKFFSSISGRTIAYWNFRSDLYFMNTRYMPFGIGYITFGGVRKSCISSARCGLLLMLT